jgi:16S rRNA (uracil1498-N3)-methyltransferase
MMQLPFFFTITSGKVGDLITVPEETSKHIISVLRMTKGEQLHLTDGKGLLMTTNIVDDHKKRCTLEVTEAAFQPFAGKSITIGISLLKNSSRFEWFLEKATEIGVTSIVPLICDRTEKQSFRLDRMQGVIESATLQSRQVWMPQLWEPIKFSHFLNADKQGNSQCLMAHCAEGEKPLLAQMNLKSAEHLQILIGPEGDFSKQEIQEALQQHYKAVSLGNTRLRTETAGMVAAVVLKQFS